MIFSRLRDLNINNISLIEYKDCLGVKINFDVIYKKYNFCDISLIFKTYDCSLKGVYWGLDEDHAGKAKYLMNKFKNKTYFCKRLIKKRLDDMIDNSKYNKEHRELLEKYSSSNN